MAKLIKKYKNRRLYDTEKSQYITFDDLQKYVIEGVRFRVEDSVTNKDLTNATLLQILVEMEAGPSQFLSSEILRQLITFAQHPMSQSFKMMFEQLVTGLESQTKNHPYFNNIQESSKTWDRNMQQIFAQWQNIFLNPKDKT